MYLLEPSWQSSATLCVGLTLLALVLRLRHRAPGVQSFAREFAIVEFLQGLWQIVGRHVRTRSAGAMQHALDLQQWQHRLHLPDQLALQQAFLPHPWLIRAMNGYYESAHLSGMFVFLVWIWWRRRRSFHTVRNAVALSTLVYLLAQLEPVAPPRLLVGSGYVDTALAYGQSVYGPYAGGLAAQLTAMPSVHVGWAFLIAWYVARLGRGPWRWLGVVHLVVTVLVVVVTGNHWWLDGVVAVLIAIPVLWAVTVLPRWWRDRHTASGDVLSNGAFRRVGGAGR